MVGEYKVDNVIVIVGPTAVGKTKLSIELAKQLDAEIISGDSMQVYKGMDIGTGKIKKSEMANIPHYMLDIREPDETFSVANYQTYVQNYLKEINLRNKLPIIVGGSGLYIQSVLFDYQFSEQKRDETVTKSLENRLQNEGNIALYNELKAIDPQQAMKIHPNNHRRVIRALEVYQTTGMTMTEKHEKQNNEPKYNHILIGLEMDRESLYNQINKRVDGMIKEGLVSEVSELYHQGYEHSQAMQAIGYKEIIPYIKGEIDLETAVERLKRNSRRYAKRQYTWFKNKMNINWFTLNGNNEACVLKDVLTIINKGIVQKK